MFIADTPLVLLQVYGSYKQYNVPKLVVVESTWTVVALDTSEISNIQPNQMIQLKSNPKEIKKYDKEEKEERKERQGLG